MNIQHLTLPEHRRILVTSDIHGHLDLFKQLLTKVNFSEDDILVIIGDLVEKGPQSLLTLRYVMNLCERHGRENVIVLPGNVDLWRIQMLEDLNDDNAHAFLQYLEGMRQWKGTSLYDEVALELGIRLDSPEQAVAAKAMMLEKCRREFDFLRSLPPVVETQQFIFVHSGLPVGDRPEELAALKNRNIYDVLKFDAFMSAGLSFRKYVVVGHWPVCLYHGHIPQANPILNREQHIISIDGGCGLKKDGQLNMLIIPDIHCDVEEITSAYCDGFESYTALTFQEESKESIHIHWGDNRIRVLRKGETFSDVEHVSSGYRLRLHNQYIRNLQEPSGETDCEDYTDYRLPVKPGDRLSLICSTQEGYLVKKDGVTGWYLGDLKEIHKDPLSRKPSAKPASKAPMNRVLLVDGSNLLFQMFLGMPARIVNPQGKAIQGTLGFVGALLKIIRQVCPTHVALLFDGEQENHRASLNPDYKANRTDFSHVPPEENPFSQIEDVYAALDFMGLKHAETDDCEADDLIAGYALSLKSEVIIASWDSDLFQLITDRVSVLRYRGKNTVLCTPAYIAEKFGVTPGQYADFKSLTGDISDNLKGADKIGPKTAALLLREFGTLENLLANAETIKRPSIRESVIRNADRLRTNYRIIKLDGTAPLPFSLEELAYQDKGLTTNAVLKGIHLK